MKKLTRSSQHKIIFGVCGGIAEYLGVSVSLVRVVVLVLSCVGSGIVLYIAGMIIMPPERPAGSSDAQSQPARVAPQSNASLTMGIGVLLVFIGTVVLLDHLNLFNLHLMWRTLRNVLVPLAIILFGIAVLMRRARSSAAPSEATPHLEQAPVSGGQWFRARYDRRLFGVCAGVAHAMNVDPTVVRLAWVVISLHSFGFGFIVYLLLALILPEEPA